MDDRDLFGKGMSFPPRIGADGQVVWSAGPANIRESIEVILSTETNERVRRTGFGAGLGRFLFEPNTPETWRLIREEISLAMRRWEPRIVVTSVDVVGAPDDATSAIATIVYRLVATDTEQRLAVAIALAG